MGMYEMSKDVIKNNHGENIFVFFGHKELFFLDSDRYSI